MTPGVGDRRRTWFSWETVAATAIGLLVFLSLRGGRALRPGNTDWLMQADPITYQLGWQFFRRSALLQWPLGANTRYGMDIGSSIVFSDSIPLLAMLFKLLNPLLPGNFQYFGLWLAACFGLQSLFAYKLLRRFTPEPVLALMGSAFFAVAPVFLFRLSQSHLTLMAQWIVLAALWLYFSPHLRVRAWAVLLLLTTWIHAYLLVMAAAIWCADLLQRVMLQQLRWRSALMQLVACSVAMVLSMWAAGYFMLGSEVGAYGLGVYRTNLMALFDPDSSWSVLLHTQRYAPGDYEGFAYLGVGVLLLAIVAVAALVRKGASAPRPGVAPLVVLAVLFTVFAVSPRVAFGPHELFSYSLPDLVTPVANAFRVSGRFFWPVYYLIFLAVLCVVFSRLPRRVALALCASALALQLLDSADGWRQLRARLAKAPAWSSPMRAPAWGDLARRYDKLLLVSPRSAPVSWVAAADFAATHGMAANTGYFARISEVSLKAMSERLIATIGRGEYSADSLYLFDEDALWKEALSHLGDADVAGTLDGFRILAPGLKRCAECAGARAAIVPAS